MIGFFLKQIYKNRQIVKYVISGGTAAFVDLLLLFIFTDILGFWYIYSATFAFIVAFFISFYLQKFWTFRDDSKKVYKQMSLYFIVAGVNLSINAGGMYVLVDKFNIMYIFAQIIMGLLIACGSFLIYRFIIFKGRPVLGGLETSESRGIKKESSEAREASSGSRLIRKDMKILIATGVFPPDIGGPATYAKNIKKEFNDLGHVVKVVTYGEESGSNNDIFIISRNQNILLRYFKFFWQLYRLLEWADVYYALDLVSAGLPAVMVAKLQHKKAVFRTGGDFLWEKAFQKGWSDLPLVDYYKEKKNFREKFLLYFSKRVLKKFDLVFFSTTLQRDIYSKYYDLPTEKIKLINNAVPQMNIPSSDKYNNSIIFVGRLIKLKNIDRLITAFSKANNSSAELLIFGDGPLKEDLKNKIKNLGMEKKIKLMGKLDHNKLMEIIGSCKFFILPSLTDISPNLALECLSMAKPIILTKHTGLDSELTKEIITIDPTSEIDIKEKIEHLLNEDNLIEYKDKLKSKEVTKREWRDVANDHIEIFYQLIKKSG